MNKKFESNFLNQVKQDSHHKETFSYIYIADLFKFPIAKIEIFSTPYIPSISGAFLIFTHTESLKSSCNISFRQLAYSVSSNNIFVPIHLS